MATFHNDPNSAQDADQNVDENSVDAAIDSELSQIKQEGLSGQQLRMARRLAQKHGLTPNDDYDAVRLLRANGIDPFLNTVIRGRTSGAQDTALATKDEGSRALGTPETAIQMQRERDIQRIQSDMRRRNRKRIFQFLTRMTAFVGLPTFIAGFYFYHVATPMYATTAEFSVENADGIASAAAPSFLAGSLKSAVDAIKVQDYLTSKEVMTRLDREQNFFAIFQDENIDAIQRLETPSTNENAFNTYKKRVLVGFDPSEGVIRMEVIAPSPADALLFAQTLLGYAEQRIDEQTDRIQSDQVKTADQIFADSEAALAAARDHVLKLQEERGVVSAEGEITAQMGRVTALEAQVLEEKLQLAELMNNQQPNQVRVRSAESRIALLEENIAELRATMTNTTDSTRSIALVAAELEQAMAEVAFRENMLARAFETREQARIEAARQTKYLTIGVNPILPQDPSYPRKFENTLLSFLLFSGIYLFLSITVSILREQVTS